MNNNITEKVERYNEIGQVVRVSLKWRGKTYMLQMFFPGSKFPSRQEVEAQVKKIYPDSVVMVHYASETQPNQPLIRVSEGAMVTKKKPKMNPKNMTVPANQPYSGPDYRRLTASHEPDGEMVQETPLSASDMMSGKTPRYLDNPQSPTLFRTGTSTNAKGEKINFSTRTNKKTGKTTVTDKFGTRDLQPIRKGSVRLNMYYEPDGETIQETPYGEITSKRIRNFKKTTTTPTNTTTNTTPTTTKKDITPTDVKKEIGEEIQENETENPTFTQFMKRIDQLPEVTREAIKNCGNDPMIAKAALEISGIDK